VAKYEFGIMESRPQAGRRYDDYDPWNYPRLAVISDDALDLVLPRLGDLPCYWHTLDWAARGIAETGINLIPPESLPQMLREFPAEEEFLSLAALLSAAAEEGKFVILFGL